jgi:hypothetical protein
MRRSASNLSPRSGFSSGAAVAALRRLVGDIPIQKQAKEAGFPATNCLYCHTEKLPKKARHAQRSGQLAHQGEENRKAGNRRRLAEGLSRRQEVA